MWRITVQQALDQRVNPLTEDQRSEIDQGWFIAGAKESLEAQLSNYNAQRSRALYNIIRYYNDDTLNFSPADSTIGILQNVNELWAKYAMVCEYYRKGDSAAVMNTLNIIPETFNLTENEASQHQLYENYFNVLLQLSSVSKSIYEADSSSVAGLYSIYNDATGRLKASIRSVLMVIDTLTYHEPYIFPDEFKSGKIRRIPVKKIYEKNEMKIFPNPTNNYVIIEYMIKDISNTKGFINIFDNNGKCLEHITLIYNHDYLVIPFRDLPNGIYICNFVVNNEIAD